MLRAEALLRRSRKGHQGHPRACTHTSMGIPFCGSFAMDARTQDDFMDAYADALDAGHVGHFSMVEQHRHMGPVTIDVDLRQAGEARAYTPSTLSAFVQAMFQALGNLVELPVGAMCFLLEKPGDLFSFRARGRYAASPGKQKLNQKVTPRDARAPGRCAACSLSSCAVHYGKSRGWSKGDPGGGHGVIPREILGEVLG